RAVDVVAREAVAGRVHALPLGLPRRMPGLLGVTVATVRLRAMTAADAIRPSLRVAAKAIDERAVPARRRGGGELVGVQGEAALHRVDGLTGGTGRDDDHQQKDRPGRSSTRRHPNPRALLARYARRSQLREVLRRRERMV